MNRRVGIIVHRAKREAWDVGAEVIAWLNARGIAVVLETESARKLERPDLAGSLEEWATLDFVLTLGGDGTILTAAHLSAPHGIPILGVHMGRFGFMAATVPEQLYTCLTQILDGNMECEERLMVQVEIWRKDERAYFEVGLNEIFNSGQPLQPAQFPDVSARCSLCRFPRRWRDCRHANGFYRLLPYPAAARLSAPTVQALIITALCPHTLSARPLLVPCDEIIEVKLDAEDGGRPVPRGQHSSLHPARRRPYSYPPRRLPDPPDRP